VRGRRRQLPNSRLAIPCYYVLAPAEASSNLARYDGVRYGTAAKEYDDLLDMYERTRAEGFGAEVKRRILIGTYVLSAGYYDAYYLQAQKLRRLITDDFNRAFETCDVIMGPTSPTVAFELGAKTDDPVAMYLSDIYTISVNLAGLPGMSIPAGFDAATARSACSSSATTSTRRGCSMSRTATSRHRLARIAHRARPRDLNKCPAFAEFDLWNGKRSSALKSTPSCSPRASCSPARPRNTAPSRTPRPARSTSRCRGCCR
jgi:hypothetical protein